MTNRSLMETAPPFGQDELAKRLSNIRKRMMDVGIDVLLVTDPDNIFYVTGASRLGGLIQMGLIVPLSGEVAFAGRAVDVVAYTQNTGSENVFPYRDHQPPEKAIAAAIVKCAGATVSIGYESASISVALHHRIRSTLPNANWVDATRIIWDICAKRSARELDYMRKAAQINSHALDRAIDAIAPGVSDSKIAAELFAGMLEAGSGPITGFNLASGPRTAIVHATFDDRRLEQDDIVHFEFSSTWNRYSAPLMRTVVLGNPNPEAVRLNDGALAAIEAVLAILREGITSGEVDAAANRELERHGVREWHYHRTGYMVGSWAGGSWGLGHIAALREDDPLVLEENMTFHLPMVLFHPGIAGAGLSETVRVTKTGVEVLTSYRRELIRL
jgi:Xaa-Pro dipeptidase